ncbi:MAG: VWA domain-containing protein [Vicinamibacterales bacterium]|nr:VWA domain-containing protein [Vicinamibacterales bacterium]
MLRQRPPSVAASVNLGVGTPWRLHAAACVLIAVVTAVIVTATGSAQQVPEQQQPPTRFRADVALVNVTVTVTDRDGRFVPNLGRDDFVVYEDGRPQPIAHFMTDRVPVSLGLVIDASGSMAGTKMDAAREALRRFVDDLLGPDDEVFVLKFDETPELVQEWTRDRVLLRERIATVRPNGGTALYDAVAEGVALAQSGGHRKKALVLISDGNDTNSVIKVDEVRRRIRETDVLVYAIGIDGEQEGPRTLPPAPRRRTPGRTPFPIPIPGGGVRFPRPPVLPTPPQPWPPVVEGGRAAPRDDRVNPATLRAMTDDSGGRTELIRTAVDLGPSTAAIANELSRQYYIAYAPASAVHDGRWHSIRVDVRNPSYHVRARRGYFY